MVKGPFSLYHCIKNYVLQKLRFPVAIAWFLLISFLFFLPGQDLPKESLFAKIPFFDKWVHMGFFFVLVWLWLWAFTIDNASVLFKIIIAIAIVYGLMVEFIQLYFVNGRSFDLFDWLTDSIGVLLAGFLRLKYIQKNRPL